MISIENILRKHITRETHKGTHARVVVQLAEEIRAEIYRELEEGLVEKTDDCDSNICDLRHVDCQSLRGWNFARSRALEIIRGEEI